MKLKIIAISILAVLCLTGFSKHKKYRLFSQDSVYSHGNISSIVFGDSPNKGVIYGPQFPYGIKIEIPEDQQFNIYDNVIELVDALAIYEEGQ